MKLPFPAIAAAFRERRVVRQPVPDVSPSDVDRIVRRDFPNGQFADVMAVLSEYASQWESVTFRVRVAALKLANGSLDLLRKHIAVAKRDYRDLLVAAEYPEYWKATLASKELSKKERERVVDADWKQYENWLWK